MTEGGKKNCCVKESYFSHNQVVKGNLLIKVHLSTSVSDYDDDEVQETEIWRKGKKKVMPSKNRNLLLWILTGMILMVVEEKR